MSFSEKAAKTVREFIRTATPAEFVTLAEKASPNLFAGKAAPRASAAKKAPRSRKPRAQNGASGGSVRRAQSRRT